MDDSHKSHFGWKHTPIDGQISQHRRQTMAQQTTKNPP